MQEKIMDEETKKKLETILNSYGMAMERRKIMTACSCGSTTFILKGLLCMNAQLINGELTIQSDLGSDVHQIICTDCEVEYDKTDFPKIKANN